VLAHLAVGDGDPRLGHQLAQPGGGLLDRRHLVVDVEDLALAQQLAPDRGGDLLLVVGPDEGEDGVALLGRRRERRHLPDAGHGHLQRARDRCRRHREHVDRGAQRLELLLVLDPEALLLVDDDEAEVLEPHLLSVSSRWVPMTRSTLPSASPASTALASLSVWKRAERLDDTGNPHTARRRCCRCCCTSRVVGHEDGDLLAVLHRLERGPHGDLGLAVADVAADEPVHRDRALHVGLDLVDGAQLVGRLDVGEGVLELALPRGVGRRRARSSPSAPSRAG
jgi:hypothetical protein